MLERQQPEMSRLLLVFISLTCCIILLLDTVDVTVVSLALPYIQGELNTRFSTASWVVTSYAIAAAIGILTAVFFSHRYGRKRFILLALIVFCIATVLCVLSTNITELIIVRFFVGLSAGFTVPLTEAYLFDVFPTNSSLAIIISSLALMIGYGIGMVMSDVIVQYFYWRWVFLVNVSIVIIAFFLACIFLYKKKPCRKNESILSVIFFIIGIIAIEFIVTQGHQFRWYQSNLIIVVTAILAVSILFFLYFSIAEKHNVIKARYLLNLKFSLAVLLFLVLGINTLAFFVLSALFFYQVVHFPPSLAGYMFIVIIIACLISAVLTQAINKYFRCEKLFLLIGIIFAALSNYMVSTLNAQMSPSEAFLPFALLGAALVLTQKSISEIIFQPEKNMNIMEEKLSLLNVFNRIGKAFGVGIVAALIATYKQFYWQQFNYNVNVASAAFKSWLNSQHLNVHSQMAVPVLARLYEKQSTLLAYLHAYRVIAILLVFLLISAICFCLIRD